MQKTTIQNIETGVTKNCDILKKNDQFLEVVLEGTTIKILLKNKEINILVNLKIWNLYLLEINIFLQHTSTN